MAIDLVSEDADSSRRFAWQDPDHRASGTSWLILAEFVSSRAVIVHVDVRKPATWWAELFQCYRAAGSIRGSLSFTASTNAIAAAASTRASSEIVSSNAFFNV